MQNLKLVRRLEEHTSVFAKIVRHKRKAEGASGVYVRLHRFVGVFMNHFTTIATLCALNSRDSA